MPITPKKMQSSSAAILLLGETIKPPSRDLTDFVVLRLFPFGDKRAALVGEGADGYHDDIDDYADSEQTARK